MPGDHIAINPTGPLLVTEGGNAYLLILVDVCTRFVLIMALPDKRSTTVAQALFDIFRKGHQQKQNYWDLHVPMAQLSMNTRIVALHNSSPFSLFFARKFNGFHNFTNDKNELLTHKELAVRLKYMTENRLPHG